MRHQSGWAKLQRHLAQLKDDETLYHLSLLEKRFQTLSNQSPEYEHVLQELDKLAYRTVGTSFHFLCAEPQRVPFRLFKLSLRYVLLIVFLLLFLPGVGMALASRHAQTTDWDRYVEIEQETQAIDTLLATEVIGPFYLTYLSPCSPTAIQQLTTAAIRVEQGSPPCTWTYIDTQLGQIIAKDEWGSMGIASRAYYREGILIAQDIFFLNNKDCFKQRSYYDPQGVLFGNQCFTEAGIAQDPEFGNGLRSPIPPPFYWFWITYR